MLLRPPTVFAFVIPALAYSPTSCGGGQVRPKPLRRIARRDALFGVLSFGAFVQIDNIEKQFVYIAMSFALLIPCSCSSVASPTRCVAGQRTSGSLLRAPLCLLGTLVVFAGASMAQSAPSRPSISRHRADLGRDAAFDAALLGGCVRLSWCRVVVEQARWPLVPELGGPGPLARCGRFIAAVPELVAGFP